MLCYALAVGAKKLTGAKVRSWLAWGREVLGWVGSGVYLQLGLIFSCNALAALLEGVSFGFIFLALHVLGGQAYSPQAPFPISSLLSFLQSLPPQKFFIYTAILSLFSQILRSSMTYIGQVRTTFFATEVQMQLQHRIFKQILSLSFPCVNRYKTGDLLKYLDIPPGLVTPLITSCNQILVSAFTICAITIMMCLLSPLLTCLAVFIFGFVSILQKTIIRKIASISNLFTHHIVEFNKSTVQSIHALRIIHTFAQQDYILQQTAGILHQIAKVTKRLYLWTQSIQPINEIVAIFLMGTFLLVGASLLRHHSSMLPLLLTFVMMIYRLSGRVQGLLSHVGGIAASWGIILRLKDILRNDNKEFTPVGGKRLFSFSQAITFYNTHLLYEETKTPAIQDVNFVIPKGCTTAFVGSSGAGKSSIMDLLLQLYQPTRGTIEVDGLNLHELDLHDWRKKIGVMSQDTFIFNDTIAENIRFGSWDASDESISKAAQMAGAHTFIERLPNGYHTVVGERGYRLSGGERQRVALARAFLRNPEILILDEATSHLDSQSEKWIQEILERMRGEKTILLVAHRLSTVMHADQIIVFEKGKVVEQGTHDHLLAQGGRYALLWTLQTQKSPVSSLMSSLK